MNSESMKNLPPEMQARLAQIMAQAQEAGAVAPVAPVAPPPPAPAPIVKPPSLMDHLIALRQETGAMRQEVGAMRQEMANLGAAIEANSGVVEAVGQATGSIYQMFQQTSNPSSTYSESFQQQQVDDSADY